MLLDSPVGFTGVDFRYGRIVKDHGKVTSYVTVKEHASFAMLRLNRKNYKKNVKNTPISTLGYGASEEKEKKVRSPVA